MLIQINETTAVNPDEITFIREEDGGTVIGFKSGEWIKEFDKTAQEIYIQLKPYGKFKHEI